MDRSEKKRVVLEEAYPKTVGIDKTEIQRRREAGECYCCAWPSDRKGAHRVKDCIRQIKLDKGTANYPKAKTYQKIKQSQRCNGRGRAQVIWMLQD